ncbi:unnamed protein product, partial [Gongylonema pulchrum]|uniref:Hydrolase_4 domain-containing protein n=1 Tax=Gongylonema pulchrum TaxID=637853 RepID=A0A183EVS3_9BILA
HCLHRRDWRFGLEHECAAEVAGIECFVTRTEAKNHIACVFVRKTKPRYTLLFSHPNGSDISDHLIGLPNLHDAARFLNCNVCSYDYSGYGISDGTPSEKNLYSDICAVYKIQFTFKHSNTPQLITSLIVITIYSPNQLHDLMSICNDYSSCTV